MSTLSTDDKQLEKMLAKEAAADEKNMKHFIKDLKAADKANAKAEKNVEKAIHGVDSAVRREHKAQAAVGKAEHKHNVAEQGVVRAQREVEMRKKQAADMEADLERKRAAVDSFQQRKNHNEQIREQRLAEVHQHAADAAVYRAGSMTASSPVDMHHPAENPATVAPSQGTGAAGGSALMEQPRVTV